MVQTAKIYVPFMEKVSLLGQWFDSFTSRNFDLEDVERPGRLAVLDGVQTERLIKMNLRHKPRGRAMSL